MSVFLSPNSPNEATGYSNTPTTWRVSAPLHTHTHLPGTLQLSELSGEPLVQSHFSHKKNSRDPSFDGQQLLRAGHDAASTGSPALGRLSGAGTQGSLAERTEGLGASEPLAGPSSAPASSGSSQACNGRQRKAGAVAVGWEHLPCAPGWRGGLQLLVVSTPPLLAGPSTAPEKGLQLVDPAGLGFGPLVLLLGRLLLLFSSVVLLLLLPALPRLALSPP